MFHFHCWCAALAAHMAQVKILQGQHSLSTWCILGLHLSRMTNNYMVCAGWVLSWFACFSLLGNSEEFSTKLSTPTSAKVGTLNLVIAKDRKSQLFLFRDCCNSRCFSYTVHRPVPSSDQLQLRRNKLQKSWIDSTRHSCFFFWQTALEILNHASR